jgi:hypothetical protein
MPLPVSGTISLSQVNTELSLPVTQGISLNDAVVRALAGKASGTISMSDLHDKSAGRVASAYIYTVHQLNGAITLSNMAGYVAGKTDVTITINAGIYMYSNSATPALNIIGGVTGDTITLINNGFIMGKGGNAQSQLNDTNYTVVPSTTGKTALQIAFPITIDTRNGYIGGGGGGGGGWNCGGGGAGGGNGGYLAGASIAGVGGGIGAVGGNGGGEPINGAGGGGGRIMPGVGGSTGNGPSNVGKVGVGGGSGGGGGVNGIYGCYSSGGGGGWGAAGASVSDYIDNVTIGTVVPGVGGSAGNAGSVGYISGGTVHTQYLYAGAAGGKAINTQGKAVTLVGASAGRIYGIIG